MKKTLPVLLGVAGLASLAATPAFAIDGLTANAALTSNYVFRGISQTAERPAVQGGLDYAVPDTGIAIGTWLSSINFGDATGQPNSPIEWDLYANYNFMLGPVNASLGVFGYVYPQSRGAYNVFELTAGLSHDFGMFAWSAKANVAPGLPKGYATIRYGSNPDMEYWLTTGISIPATEWFSFSGNVSYQGYGGLPVGVKNDSFVEYDIGGTITFDKYSLDLRYIDTDTHAFPGGKYFTTGGFFVATFIFKFP